MFGFISFGVKIILASIMGGAINYIPGEIDNSHKIVESSLICIFSASILALVRQFSDKGESLAMGFGILAVIIMVCSLSKHMEFGKRIIWLFASVIGMIIGSGFIIQACLLGALIYLILHNSENIMEYIYNKPEEMSDSSIENISK